MMHGQPSIKISFLVLAWMGHRQANIHKSLKMPVNITQLVNVVESHDNDELFYVHQYF
jgi:hypothetical protein